MLRTLLRSSMIGGILLTLTAALPAQMAKPAPKTAAPAPAPMAPAPPAAVQAPATAAQAPATTTRQRIIIDEPIRVYDPLFDYPYPYAYPPDYMSQNFGYIKLDTHMKNASVYVDGGFADKVEKARRFALRPGTHNIEVRDDDGREVFHEKIAVLAGKTTTLHING